MSKNVLIVSHSFPPLNNIAARRFGFLTPHLERHGWTPWVLTTESNGPLPVGISAEQVIRIGRHPQATERIESPAAHKKRLPPAARAVRGLLAHTKMQLRAVDYTCFAWRRQAVERTEEVRRRLPRIDAVVGTFGPAASLWIARHFANLLGAPWAADFRDLAALRHDGRPAIARFIDRMIESRLLRGAAAITATGRLWADILERAHGIPAAVVYNGWDAEVFTAGSHNRDAVARLSGSRYLHYAGRFYPERMKAAFTVLAALAAEPGLRLLVRSLGPPHLEKAFCDEAKRLGVRNRVHLMQPCPPAQIAAETDLAAANLVLDDVVDSFESSRGVLTGKFLELVAGRRPVLAVTQPASEMGPILAATKKGRICSTAEEIRSFLRDIEGGTVNCEGDRPEIDRYSKASQAAVLAEVLNAAAGFRTTDIPVCRRDADITVCRPMTGKNAYPPENSFIYSFTESDQSGDDAPCAAGGRRAS